MIIVSLLVVVVTGIARVTFLGGDKTGWHQGGDTGVNMGRGKGIAPVKEG